MSRREFPVSVKKAAWERSGGVCECGCGTPISAATGVEYDHIVPDALGGPPTLENCMVMTVRCHRHTKTSDKSALAGGDVQKIAKADRLAKKAAGITPRKAKIGNPRFRRKVDGTVERRS